jgi:hypothetical protein
LTNEADFYSACAYTTSALAMGYAERAQRTGLLRSVSRGEPVRQRASSLRGRTASAVRTAVLFREVGISGSWAIVGVGAGRSSSISDAHRARQWERSPKTLLRAVGRTVSLLGRKSP